MPKSIIDYIIEQADRFDKRNLQFEKDILFTIKRNTDKLVAVIPSLCTNDITNQIRLNNLIEGITNKYRQYTSAYKSLINSNFMKYYDMAYKNTMELIDVGNEVSNSFSHNVSELQQYDEDTIDIVEDHAFELLTGYCDVEINKIRAKLTDMFLRGVATKSNVRSFLEKELGVGKSKAEEIAQTELSRIYNMGTMKRLHEYQKVSGERVRKYWYGFKYSPNTCSYCQPRIGNIYDLDDESESLPAHVRCRCCWLPILESWEIAPVGLLSRSNMLNTGYSSDMVYQRINTRLNIDYADFWDEQAARDYLAGDRSTSMYRIIEKAREAYIANLEEAFGIQADTSNSSMSHEFNAQMRFWKRYVATQLADKNTDNIYRSIEAIKGVMVLPWNADQMSKWSEFLSKIKVN